MLLFFQNAFIDSIIEQSALKNRKLFLLQLLHISLDANLLSLHEPTFFRFIFRIVFLMCVIFYVLNNVTFNDVTNHNDYHKIRQRDCWGLIKVYLLFSRKKCRTKKETVECFFLLLECCSLFLSSTEHSQGFFICFTIKNPLNSPRIAFYFPKQTLFSQRTKLSSACYSLKTHA